MLGSCVQVTVRVTGERVTAPVKVNNRISKVINRSVAVSIKTVKRPEHCFVADGGQMY